MSWWLASRIEALPSLSVGRSCRTGEAPQPRSIARCLGAFSMLSTRRTSKSWSGIESLSPPNGFVGSETRRFRSSLACAWIAESDYLRKVRLCQPECLPARWPPMPKKCSMESASCLEPRGSRSRYASSCGGFLPIRGIPMTSSSS